MRAGTVGDGEAVATGEAVVTGIVVVSNTETVPLLRELATYAYAPLGITATPRGELPTPTVAVTAVSQGIATWSVKHKKTKN
ncbi:MAG: hypothetical protein ABSD42_08100 [Candidatus Bathyarchaeia archaeon]|jgi:hypothetical protein